MAFSLGGPSGKRKRVQSLLVETVFRRREFTELVHESSNAAIGRSHLLDSTHEDVDPFVERCIGVLAVKARNVKDRTHELPIENLETSRNKTPRRF